MMNSEEKDVWYLVPCLSMHIVQVYELQSYINVAYCEGCYRSLPPYSMYRAQWFKNLLEFKPSDTKPRCSPECQ